MQGPVLYTRARLAAPTAMDRHSARAAQQEQRAQRTRRDACRAAATEAPHSRRRGRDGRHATAQQARKVFSKARENRKHPLDLHGRCLLRLFCLFSCGNTEKDTPEFVYAQTN